MTAPASTPTKAVAWVRYRSDGGHEGPLMDSDPRMDGARKTSGAWQALVHPAQQAEPDWRELCRRLYVELFYCDQQMTQSNNTRKRPIFTQGVTVRDVLRDAKAALEATPGDNQE